MSPSRIKSAAMAIAFLLMSGCGAAVDPTPSSTVAPASGSTPTASELSREVCDSTGSALVVSAWQMVAASIGASDHADMIDNLDEAVAAAEDRAGEDCVGLDELDDLGIEVTLLISSVADGTAEDSDYEAVSDAGNAWLSTVGDSDNRFDAAPSLPKKPSLTVSQEQAIGKAQDYLDYTAFSKSGLVDQLVYEGFSKKDAQFAADHLDVDWMEQAALKAKEYLDYTSFSRKGLIAQLMYEGFTRKQAEHGAKAVGL